MAVYETLHCPMFSFSIHLALSDCWQSDEYKRISNTVLIYVSLITGDWIFFIVFGPFYYLLWISCLHIWHVFRGVVVFFLLVCKNFSYVVDVKLWSIVCVNIISQFRACLLTLFMGWFGFFFSYASIYFSKKLVETQSVCRKLCTAWWPYPALSQSWPSLKGNYCSHF